MAVIERVPITNCGNGVEQFIIVSDAANPVNVGKNASKLLPFCEVMHSLLFPAPLESLVKETKPGFFEGQLICHNGQCRFFDGET